MSTIINVLKHYLPLPIKLIMYKSLVLPHLNYGLFARGYNTQRIDKVLKKIIRNIHVAKYNAHTDSLYKSLNLLKIADLFKIKMLKLYYKYEKNDLPSNLLNLQITPNSEFHNYETRHRNDIHLQRFRYKYTKNCIRYKISEYINNLPDIVTSRIHSHSIAFISQQYKILLIEEYRIICQIPHCYVCNNSNL